MERVPLATIAALILISISRRAAADAWTPADSALEATYVTLAAADYLQTRQIARDGRESNPIMGSHGQRVDVNLYFAATTAAHVVAAALLPQPYRAIVQMVGISVQATTVGRNYAAGYVVRF
jgi:hypothetical protein